MLSCYEDPWPSHPPLPPGCGYRPFLRRVQREVSRLQLALFTLSFAGPFFQRLSSLCSLEGAIQTTQPC